MTKTFTRNLIIVLILILALAIFFISRNTGKINNENNNNSLKNKIFFVYAVIDENTNLVKVYRFDIENSQREMIYSFSLKPDQQKPDFHKYQSDKILIERAESYSYSKLIGLSGQKITEFYKSLEPYYGFLFSPDNEFVAFNTITDDHYLFKIHSIITEEDTLIPWGSITGLTGYLIPEKWSKDNTIIYASIGFEGGVYIPGLYTVDINNKEVKEINKTKELGLIQLSLDNNFNVYGLTEKNYNPFEEKYAQIIYKFNTGTSEVTKFELKNTSVSLLGRVNETGRKIFYICPISDTTADLCYCDFQTSQEKRITKGKIVEHDDVFWSDNMIIYKQQEGANISSLHIFNTETNEDIVITQSNEFQGDKPVDIEAINIFNK